MSVSAPIHYLFDAFRFEPDTRRLSRDGATVRLGPRAADVLSVLLESSGRMVTRDELIAKAWNGTSVERQNVTVQVHEIRDALGDDPDTPVYIETIARRGYRFIRPVTIVVDNAGEHVKAIDSRVDQKRTFPGERQLDKLWRARFALVVGALLVIAAAMAFGFVDSREPPLPKVLRISPITHDGKSKGQPLLADDSLYFKSGGKYYALRLGSGVPDRVQGLDPYTLLDISSKRGEALAFRPDDRGAETALWAVRLNGSAPRRVGAVLVSDHAATWSHDGRRIAYANEHTVYITDNDGTLTKSLASFTGEVSAIQWAPFDRFLRVDVSERVNRTARYKQYDVMFTSGQPTRPASFTATDICCGTWVAGSDDYVLTRTPLEGAELWLVREVRGRLFQRPSARGALTSFAGSIAFASPVSSSDGSTLYALGRTDVQLSTYDSTRQTFVPYLGGISAYAVSFSPDRRSVAYIRTADNTLWRAAADGTHARQLTFAPWTVDALAWSPDGSRLAIRAHGPGSDHTRIHLLQSSGGQAVPLDPRDVEQGSPTWSADGTQIAFGDVPESYGTPTGAECIHIYDLVKQTTIDVPNSAGLWSSRWSPTGRYLAATRIADRRLMLYDFAFGTWRDLRLVHVGEVTWLNDTSILAEPEGPAHAVMRVQVPDGRLEPLLDVQELSVHSGAGVGLNGQPLFLPARTDLYAIQLTRK